MKSKINKNSTRIPKEFNFFVGDFKGEVRRARAVWSKCLKLADGNQVDSKMVKQICAPIPKNQDALVAIAKGERPEADLSTHILYIKYP